MNSRDAALTLARAGYYVFPLEGGTKTPVVPFKEEATRNERKIDAWFWDDIFLCERGYDVGVYTGHPDAPLVVIDIDTKNGKDGFTAFGALTYEHRASHLHNDFTQTTATGGAHVVMKAGASVSGGVNKVGDGLDIKSSGGFIKVYEPEKFPLYDQLNGAPDWLINLCGRPREQAAATATSPVDQESAAWRAVQYLEKAPAALEGEGGDDATYRVACRVKDCGVDEATAVQLIHESSWNSRCTPPWSRDELATKVHNAYRYGTEPIGVGHPEGVFPPVPGVEVDEDAPRVKTQERHPRDVALRLNREFAYMVDRGRPRILRETTIPGKRILRREFMQVDAFHGLLAANRIPVTNDDPPKYDQETKVWMSHPERRTYDRIVFKPEGAHPGELNTWQGFAIEPLDPKKAKPRWVKALENWLLVIRENIAQGDEEVANWVIDWFAQAVQEPGKKPQTALVIRGEEQGSGKTSTVERVIDLFGDHGMVDSKGNTIGSNFNAHLEHCLMFLWDESDRKGGVSPSDLRHLVSASQYVIQPKGVDSYKAKAYARWALITNDPWVIKANATERRYCIVEARNRLARPAEFFIEIREAMEDGGDRVLLHYLMNREIKSNLNKVLNTEGLIDQKEMSLSPFEEWWLECLYEGRIGAQPWPEEILADDLLRATKTYWKNYVSGNTYKPPNRTWLTRELNKVSRGVTSTRRGAINDRRRVYLLPDLATSRKEWDGRMGSKTDWGGEEDDGFGLW